MKLVITGGTGFIGHWFLDLFGREHEIRILGIEEDLDELVIGDKTFEFIRTDFSEKQLVPLLDGFESVLHLAARRYQPGDTMEDFLENIRISSSLFEACRKSGIQNVVHLSSIGVYSPDQGLPWQEDQAVNPSTFYAIAKLVVEKMSHIYNRNHGMKIKNLRVAQVLGPGEREGFMLSVFLKKAMNGETITVYGKGGGRREYIYVKDLAGAIHAALGKNDISGVFNIGSGSNTSHKELAETINRVFGNTGKLEFLEQKKEDKTVHLMDSERAARILGWRPGWTLQKALEDMKTLMTGG